MNVLFVCIQNAGVVVPGPSAGFAGAALLGDFAKTRRRVGRFGWRVKKPRLLRSRGIVAAGQEGNTAGAEGRQDHDGNLINSTVIIELGGTPFQKCRWDVA